MRTCSVLGKAVDMGGFARAGTEKQLNPRAHYHIHLIEKDGSIKWRLKTGVQKIDNFFYHL